MATHDYIISNASGAAVRADLNNALAAIATNNSSATAPTTTYAYQWWADTGSTPTVMKLRNAANSAWITLFQLDGEWSLIPFENGTAAAPSIYFKDSGTDTGLFSPGVDQVGITTGGAVRLTTSTTAFTGTLPWQGQNGTAAAPALSFSGDPNTGVYNVGADNIGVSTNGTLRFDVSTTATTSTLPVVHPLGAVATPSITFTGDTNTGIYSPGADQVAISTNGTQRLTTDTAAVTSTLPVVHPLGAVATPSVTFTGDLNTGIWSPAADTIAFSEGGAEAMRIDSSSRLLVGTSSYTGEASLAIKASSAGGSTQAQLVLQRGQTNPAPDLTLGVIKFADADSTGHIGAEIAAQSDGGFSWASNDYPTRLVFSTTADGASSPTERMRITQQGDVLISNTNRATQGRLCVDGITSTQPAISCFQNATTTQEQITFRNPNSVVGTITTNGSTTAYNQSSDYRLKENVTAVSDGITRLQQLKPSRFNFIADPDCIVDGFIAHEVQAVVPEAVTGEKDAVDSDGNPKYQGIDQSKLVPLLTAALQEAIGEIESLKARVAALEAS